MIHIYTKTIQIQYCLDLDNDDGNTGFPDEASAILETIQGDIEALITDINEYGEESGEARMTVSEQVVYSSDPETRCSDYQTDAPCDGTTFYRNANGELTCTVCKHTFTRP